MLLKIMLVARIRVKFSFYLAANDNNKVTIAEAGAFAPLVALNMNRTKHQRA
jgi:hypothetical protein